MHLNFIKDMRVLSVLAVAASAQTLLTTAVVDMRGFDSVVFVAHLGDVADTSVLTLTGQTGEESDGSDAADLALPVTFTADASSGDNNLLVLDLHKPRQRYVRATLGRGVANAAVSGVVAILYNSSQRPVVEDVSVVASRLINDPAPA